jgi:hypothetical protein
MSLVLYPPVNSKLSPELQQKQREANEAAQSFRGRVAMRSLNNLSLRPGAPGWVELETDVEFLARLEANGVSDDIQAVLLMEKRARQSKVERSPARIFLDDCVSSWGELVTLFGFLVKLAFWTVGIGLSLILAIGLFGWLATVVTPLVGFAILICYMFLRLENKIEQKNNN